MSLRPSGPGDVAVSHSAIMNKVRSAQNPLGKVVQRPAAFNVKLRIKK